MQLESHATPPRTSPQQRYANLHRAIERGLDSDEVWRELADVSVSLGHKEEAVQCVQRIRNDTMRLALESRLARLGLMVAAIDPATTVHDVAPAASNAGTRPAAAADAHRLRDHVVDAFQYLFHQHMPWLVLVTTLAFPLVIGVGGFLTAGDSPLLLAAIATLPGLCVLGIVGAMGRQILLAGADGNGDVPPLPSFGELIADARRFFVDVGLVLGSLVGPSVLAVWLGAPLSSTLPGLCIGAFFAPMAFGLRHLHRTLDALSPVTLVRSLARTGLGYAGLAAVVVALLTPAAAVAWVSLGHPVWLQIAIVGPLCVLPLFVSARLLGTWLEVHRGVLVGTAARTRECKAPVAPVVQAAAAAAPTPRRPRRPEALEQFKAPTMGRTNKPTKPKRAKPAPAKPANPAPAAAAPAKATPRAIEGRSPSPRPTDAPDLAHMPGAVVVSGNERSRQGAASKRP